jgi:predicted AAA+ superfamily ATPase
LKRFIDYYLNQWVKDDLHKPLLLRGARQIGKTFAVRNLGKKFTNYVEINFEEINCKNVFEKDLNPKRILQELSLITGQSIIPGKTLLFLDEAQEVPRAILALRYFYEKIPALHVIAAGSLLDFALEKVGIPVGRVESIYMYPLSWLEFLLAKGEHLLFDALFQFSPEQPASEAVHTKLLGLLSEYFAIGGMPEVVSSWVKKQDPQRCFKIQQSLRDAYRQDFEKYAKQHQIKYVEILFEQVPKQLGRKFKFSDIPGEFRKRELMPCFELLVKAGVIHPVYQTHAQGLPLGADADMNQFKMIFLDIGLAQASLGLDLKDWFLNPDTAFVNQGSIVETFVGQEMLVYSYPFQKKPLYYWHREARGSNAEIDYVTHLQGKIIPIEVKSGTSGSLKGLKEFLICHPKTPYSIRFSGHNYSTHNNLLSYPLYAISKAIQFALDEEFKRFFLR